MQNNYNFLKIKIMYLFKIVIILDSYITMKQIEKLFKLYFSFN